MTRLGCLLERHEGWPTASADLRTICQVHASDADAVRLFRGLRKLKASMLVCSACFFLRMVSGVFWAG